MVLPGLVWMVIGGLLLTVGDIVFKFWIKSAHLWQYLFGFFLYLIGLMCLVESFKTHNIAVATAIFVVVNIVVLSIVSWLIFNEPLNYQQMVGIALAIGAVLLLA